MAIFSSTQPSLRARVLPRFPANVVAGSGMIINKSGSTYTFAVDIPAFVGSVFTPEQHGGIGNGIADDSTAIQSAVNAAAAVNGGTVYFAPKVYAHSQTITVSSPGITLLGIGVPSYAGPLSTPRSELKWIGAVSGTQLRFRYPDPSAIDSLWGGGVQGIYLNGVGVAGTGLELAGVVGSNFTNVGFLDHTVRQLYLHCTTNGPSTQRNNFQNLMFQNSYNGHSFVLDGEAGNSSFNIAENININHNNGDALLFKNSDNNLFEKVYIFRTPGGTGRGIVFSSGTTGVARNNIVLHTTCSTSGIVSENGSSNNRVDYLDEENGVAPVTWGAGTTMIVKGVSGAAPFFYVTKNGTNQTGVVAGVETLVTFPSISVDSRSQFDTGTSTFKPSAGNIYLQAMVSFTGGVSAGEAYEVRIVRDSSPIARTIVTAGAASVFCDLSTVDFQNTTGAFAYGVHVIAFSGVNKTIDGGTANTFFKGTMLW